MFFFPVYLLANGITDSTRITPYTLVTNALCWSGWLEQGNLELNQVSVCLFVCLMFVYYSLLIEIARLDELAC